VNDPAGANFTTAPGWRAREPDDAGGGEDCGAISTLCSGGSPDAWSGCAIEFVDRACQLELPFVCACERSAFSKWSGEGGLQTCLLPCVVLTVRRLAH
jgi:hypothetical protein